MVAEESKGFSIPAWPLLLDARRVSFQKAYKFIRYDVGKDRAALDEMVKISGVRSVPVIDTCNEVMVGFDRTRLEQILSCIRQWSEV